MSALLLVLGVVLGAVVLVSAGAGRLAAVGRAVEPPLVAPRGTRFGEGPRRAQRARSRTDRP
ncbi:hypothetical protein [Quadrisphaera sp. DSM 44207]|uniref:hypothetical protein n=1 Tax=Quadrisphaera sp. DSM 44207 TaxID=1881057 RepID=UPI00088C5131|nr:hypothetical protein [Quadrisphaera sp. DSM 44207]SDQ63062.1 hypothetical protein SAMN05428996_2158 [Quadrisphaera sp. DSM 44207]